MVGRLLVEKNCASDGTVYCKINEKEKREILQVRELNRILIQQWLRLMFHKQFKKKTTNNATALIQNGVQSLLWNQGNRNAITHLKLSILKRLKWEISDS